MLTQHGDRLDAQRPVIPTKERRNQKILCASRDEGVNLQGPGAKAAELQAQIEHRGTVAAKTQRGKNSMRPELVKFL